MIYGDDELLAWWRGLGTYERDRLIENILANAESEVVVDIATKVGNGASPSVKQLQVLRKWARD